MATPAEKELAMQRARAAVNMGKKVRGAPKAPASSRPAPKPRAPREFDGREAGVVRR